MKYTKQKSIFLLLQCLCLSVLGQQSLEGKILDKADHQPLIGAAIYIPDLRTGVTTNLDGNFVLPNLPAGKFLVQVKMMGYKTYAEVVDLNITNRIEVELLPASIQAGEVVVTGSAFTTIHEESSLQVIPMDRKQLLSAGATNLSNALSQVQGVSGISTGASITKPVIRGLGYNRIVTINEGLRQEGQQWGDEHGLEIDMFSADRIEILKGPGSLLFGSDALGGVINILEPLPAPLNSIRGDVHTQWSSNNAGATLSALLEGNQKGFIWRGRATYRNNAAYATPVERVYNAANKEMNVNLLAGLNRKWGFSHLHGSIFSSQLGLVEGERDSISGAFLDHDGSVVRDEDAFTRQIALPFQRISHYKIHTVNSIFIGKSNLRIVAGWQQNNREEYEDDVEEPGLFFQLNTYSADAKYYLEERNGWQTVFGASYLFQMNRNKGIEFLIPDYEMNDVGGFVSVQKKIGAVNLNAGLREEFRVINGDLLIEDADTLFAQFKNNFSALSASAGMAWQLNERINLKLNAGRGFRAPNISELAANGVHEGTFRYEIGNPNLDPETSLQLDAGGAYSTKNISLEFSAFYNYIDQFIYYSNFNSEEIAVDDIYYPVFRYIQGNAVLKGYEAGIDLHPVDRLHFSNTFAYVKGTNVESNTSLPFIPPFHYKGELQYNLDNLNGKGLRNSFIRFSCDYFSRQDELDQFETITAAATVFGAGAGTEVKLLGSWMDFNIAITNISNVKYYNHLSRLKSAGILEMGRNITFSLHVPFDVKK